MPCSAFWPNMTTEPMNLTPMRTLIREAFVPHYAGLANVTCHAAAKKLSTHSGTATSGLLQ
jgi:hypothetical protein